ncbi:MAG TPA: excinuclease ABC subunit UvrA, partial [bacterium]|nr:excinuclease ABC subunit UvrA [bacterium]
MPIEKIVIRGAREHNLKNIDVEIPRDKLVVLTGLSGSGKSSLAFDTIFAEGQRRYVESLSAYARQFLEQMSKPDVDVIEGLSPAVSIEQKTSSRNPRSTVGTVTEIYDYLRLLFARVGVPHCYKCGKPIQSQTTPQMVDAILALGEGTKIHLLAPVVRSRKGEYQKEFRDWQKAGFVRVKVDGTVYELGDEIRLDKMKKHDVDLFVDRLVVKADQRGRVTDSVETCVKMASGLCRVEVLGDNGKVANTILMSENFACVDDGISYPELEPRMFSFNNPHGACPGCDGLGAHTVFDEDLVVDRDAPLKDAIRPWRREGSSEESDFDRVADALAAHWKFDITAPWKKIPAEARAAILHGSTEPITVKGKRLSSYKQVFEGVIPLLTRQHENSWEWQQQVLEQFMIDKPCETCNGTRLRQEARFVRVGGRAIHELTSLNLRQAREHFETLQLPAREHEIARRILKEIRERLGFLTDIGLEYLSLDRGTATLSGGEGQRIRLATQISSSLVGVLYILDEPSIGLHQRDND